MCAHARVWQCVAVRKVCVCVRRRGGAGARGGGVLHLRFICDDAVCWLELLHQRLLDVLLHRPAKLCCHTPRGVRLAVA